MKLSELPDREWHKWEEQRFLNDDTKTATDAFDPEAFKHDGFSDREAYLDTYVPALREQSRLDAELNEFTPPRLKEMNDSPYQALVIRYGILRTLIQQPDYSMAKEDLLEAVKSWQQTLAEAFADTEFPATDDLLHLAKAAIDYRNDIDDSELHLVHSYFEFHNLSYKRKDKHYQWLNLFERLSSVGRFPKVSRTEKPSHALDTIGKGLWSLQEQALVYEVADSKSGHLVGIPDDYTDYIQDWLYYEMSDENYRGMLDALAVFDNQSKLIEARDAFDIETPTKGLNAKRRESIIEAGVFPSDLLGTVLKKNELKAVVDTYDIDAHRGKTDEMVRGIVAYFEQSQRMIEGNEPRVDLYLKYYEDISDGNIGQVPPQLQAVVDGEDSSTKLDVLFEEATADICTDVFHLENTTLLGQHTNGIVADGEVEQDGAWLLWDNKRRTGEFKLGSSTQSKIKTYVDNKKQQHDVEWFLIIAPEFSETAKANANKLEMQLGVDIRLVRAADFKELACFWKETIADESQALPLSVFYGSEELDLGIVTDNLTKQFA